jgi:hypothetical protein
MRKSKFFYRRGKISNLLFEQEEDLFATEEEGGEEEAEDEGAEEAADEEGDEGDDEAAEAGDDEEAEEEVPEEAKMKLGKVIDDDLEALLVDFETQARQSKKIEKEENKDTMDESMSLTRALFESNHEDEIDLERFTSEVARLIKNYDTLLDMEDMILSKAKSFIIARYGEDAASEVENSLADNHGIEITVPKQSPMDSDDIPVAVGAGKAGE